jgi:hypothetical protein
MPLIHGDGGSSVALDDARGVKSSGEGSGPLAIDLCCGLGGWTEGLLAEGYRVRGYDIEAHEYGDERYPAELVLKSILDLHGSELADADLIVASPPCQKYSYMAMPWGRSKAMAAAIRADTTGKALAELNALFDACFRLQREASEAAGRHIPMVVENVRGAQPWVGRAAWNYGSYYLWGDLPALMPNTVGGRKVPGFRFDGSGGSFQTASVNEHIKVPATAGGRRTDPGKGARFTSRDCGAEVAEGRKGAGAGAAWFDQNLCQLSSKSSARKAASAKIAKIPFALSSHIARVYRPETPIQPDAPVDERAPMRAAAHPRDHIKKPSAPHVIGDATLYLGDCADPADLAVDHMIGDPPYEDELHKAFGQEDRPQRRRASCPQREHAPAA